MSDIQLTGNLQLNAGGLTALADVSEFVSEFRLTLTRDHVEVPPTATQRRHTAAGSPRDSLTVAFYDDILPTGIWARFFQVIRSTKAEMAFAGSLNPGTAGTSDNPLFEGTAVVTELDTGAEVGRLRIQTLTLPVKSLTVTGGPA
jgi:hypothetical protein